MIEINAIKLTDRSVVAACSGGSRFRTTGLPVASFGVGFTGLSTVCGDERPTKASAAARAVAADVRPYAALEAAVDAGKGLVGTASQMDSATQKHQTIQHHTMWAFRGPEPWRDPA